ncbi:MAG: hypothetical protein UZ22_OP11002000808, partial [Microgenomates bacterium OLB23]
GYVLALLLARFLGVVLLGCLRLAGSTCLGPLSPGRTDGNLDGRPTGTCPDMAGAPTGVGVHGHL